jgi:hypothetical protein
VRPDFCNGIFAVRRAKSCDVADFLDDAMRCIDLPDETNWKISRRSSESNRERNRSRNRESITEKIRPSVGEHKADWTRLVIGKADGAAGLAEPYRPVTEVRKIALLIGYEMFGHPMRHQL